jgi:hypothetical protein
MDLTINHTTPMGDAPNPQNADPSTQPQVDPKKKKRNAQFKQWIDVTKSYRKKLIANWTTSIDYRRGKPFASQTDDDTIAVNLDWSLTKAKQASLFSQVPQVRIAHHPNTEQAGPWVAIFERKLNDELIKAGIESAMDEVLPDCINASGIGIVSVSYECIHEDKEVPSIDLAVLPPEIHQQILQSGALPDGTEIPMETVPQVVAKRYIVRRISPSDFLWPIDFTGSNFDNAPWLGRSGRIPWGEAAIKFNLSEEDKESYLGVDNDPNTRLTADLDRNTMDVDEKVEFNEIFYKEYVYDSEAKSYETIHHLVFIANHPDPVIDEPWNGQRLDEQNGTILGSLKYPIRVLSLTYITDETIPPSDSAIGRPQVNEINKSRTQMIRQRERSIPVRWINPDRVDPMIQQALMRGTWQNFIPIQGDGARAIGEVARANYAQEDFTFDQIAKRDLSESWTIGPNQMGSGADVETKGESTEIAQGFQTRIGRERAKVASHFVSIAEVLGSLMILYEDPSTFGQGFEPALSRALSFSILADSTVLVDANQRLQRINQFLNMYAKSGWVNIEPILKEAATLTGLDPNVVIQPPQPKPPVEPNISLRLTGTEDMMNPLTLAFLIGAGQGPKPENIELAKKLIQQAVTAPPGLQLEGGPGTPGAMPMGMMPQGQPPIPQPAPPAVGQANQDMASLPKITKRSNAPVEES